MKTGFAGISIFVAVSLIVTACTSAVVNVNQADKADRFARVLRTRLEFVDQASQAVRYPIVEQKASERDGYRNTSFPDPMELSFHAVSGRLAGRDVDRFFRIRLKRAYSSLEPGTQDDFAISLAAIENMISTRASAYVPKPEDDGFKVEPADTRFARLVLSAGDPFYYPHFEREAGFIDRKIGSDFALLYGDRPCRISGAIRANDGVFRHELSFDRAGLHWMRIQSTGEGTMLVTRSDPSSSPVVYARIAK